MCRCKPRTYADTLTIYYHKRQSLPRNVNVIEVIKLADVLTEDEFCKLKIFVDFFALIFFPLDTNAGRAVQDSLKKINSMSRARAVKGLMAAANDVLSDTLEWPLEKVAQADNDLRGLNGFTLSEWRFRQSKKVRRIMEKGKIGNIIDYYLIKALVVDHCLDEANAANAEHMLNVFEEKYVARSKKPR